MTWHTYFDACQRNDLWDAFNALASIGVLPVVNGEDKNGKIIRKALRPEIAVARSSKA